MQKPQELDVTKLVPREKHPTIFRTFDSLGAGESFILINDHDPMPLRHQFSFERANRFNWEYLEQGPETWRVRLTKTK
jgi:uncharacterized protein (DUF2249 family)